MANPTVYFGPQLDAGPITGNAVQFYGTPPTASVELHMIAGQSSQNPSYTSCPDAQATVPVNGAVTKQLNVSSGLGAGVIFFSNPAILFF